MRAIDNKGYSLVEALAAIAIVGMALLVSTNALQTHARLARRAEIQHEMLRSAEDALESVRGGEVPLEEGPLQLISEVGEFSRRAVYTMVRIEELETEGLYEVTARSRTHFVDQPMELELRTMVWRPE